MPAPGTSTTKRTSASRCASRSRDEDFVTIHHELGHNYYQLAYNNQPFLFRERRERWIPRGHRRHHCAVHHAGVFGEDRPARQPSRPPRRTFRLLLQQALEKVAFLPFGLMIDKWRWQVFSGEIKPGDYNKAWWDLRLKYQGIVPPVAAQRGGFRSRREVSRCRRTFPTCATSSPTSTSSSSIARCAASPDTRDPLNRCTFYGSKEAGAKFNEMLAMGQSKPWPDAHGSADRPARDGRHRDPGIFRAAAEVAGRAEQGDEGGVVNTYLTTTYDVLRL